MMTEVYADSGYWVALLNPRDQWYEKARLVADQIKGRRIVTSEMVFVEFLNSMSRYGADKRRQSVEAMQRLYDNPNIEVVPQTTAQLKSAAELYVRRLDQRWSITDCASFIIMEQRGLTDALAYDRDFVQAGFRALLREA